MRKIFSGLEFIPAGARGNAVAYTELFFMFLVTGIGSWWSGGASRRPGSIPEYPPLDSSIGRAADL
ncbi:putative membrane protein [Xanthomonas euvesicatoria pv. vesicatoria str. 85-10]|uniref:Putative membrane protein n=1 Tax=Xanthomonas euvesicatoria pv. vesicatoria (strain 85-10) TaxID=316273 RepID=Q3BN76_XANE5|nr:putative membrane protein [Xanthomonas euvesicatoria pv. vesicatoria str. 85-10]